MSAESPRQLELPNINVDRHKRLQVYRIPETPDNRIHPTKDQLPLPDITVPREYTSSQYKLPEFRVPEEGIAVPVTATNIFRDEESMHLSALGGTLQLVQTIYEASFDETERPNVINKESDKKIMERNVTMWGYAPTQDTVVTLIDTFQDEVEKRKEEREKRFSSVLGKKTVQPSTPVFEYSVGERAAD